MLFFIFCLFMAAAVYARLSTEVAWYFQETDRVLDNPDWGSISRLTADARTRYRTLQKRCG